LGESHGKLLGARHTGTAARSGENGEVISDRKSQISKFTSPPQPEIYNLKSEI